MDPNATLKAIRELITEVSEREASDVDPNEWEDLTTKVSALDAWLTSGGFLPTDWRSDARKAHADGKELGYQRGFADGHKVGYAAGEAAGPESAG